MVNDKSKPGNEPPADDQSAVWPAAARKPSGMVATPAHVTLERVIRNLIEAGLDASRDARVAREARDFHGAELLVEAAQRAFQLAHELTWELSK